MKIGEKIKNLRIKNALTQEELANRCELTKGFISQLERDNTSPSVDTLELIVRALGTNLAEFFSEADSEPVVYHLADAIAMHEDDLGHTMHFLVPNAQKLDMEPILLKLAPQGRSKIYPPFEGQAFGFLLNGEVTLHLSDATFDLTERDSFYFEADRAFFVENTGKEGAQLIWVLSPPNF